MHEQRPIKPEQDGPWCWCTKAALQKLRDYLGESADGAGRARSVYLALCELASDEASPRFKESKSLIAFRAGVSVRTVQRVFPDLERAGIITVERAVGRQDKSTYTLLSVKGSAGHNGSTIGHPDSSTGQYDLTIGHGAGKGQVADKVEEQSEETERKEKEIAGAPPSAIFVPSVTEDKARRRKLLLAALVSLDGSDPLQTTRSGWGRAARALHDIQGVHAEVTSEEVIRRARIYRKRFPGAAISPTALSQNWAACDRESQALPTAPKQYI